MANALADHAPAVATTSAHVPGAFGRLAWSNLAAQSAEQIGLAAAPLVAVLALGAGPGATGALQTAQTLPFLLLALPAGVLADRTSRRRLMAGAEALRAVALAAVLGLAATGLLTLPRLALLGFVGACGTVAYSVAVPALVPALVAPAALATANARIELARTIAFVGGPVLAGALVAWTGSAAAFAAAAALSVGAVVLLAGLREPSRPASRRRHLAHELGEGAAFVLRHPWLRPILLTKIVFGAAFFMLQAVYVPYAVQHLGLSASGVGGTLAIYGVGMVVGALAAAPIMRALPFGVVVAIGPLSGLAGAIAMALTIRAPLPVLAGVGFFLIGAGPVVWIISTATLRQTVTPPALLGRVSAIDITAYGARTVGAALGGAGGRPLRRRDVPGRGRPRLPRSGGDHRDVASSSVSPARRRSEASTSTGIRSPSEQRGAPRLCRGAPNVWGLGGHLGAPILMNRLGGHLEAPMFTTGAGARSVSTIVASEEVREKRSERRRGVARSIQRQVRPMGG